MSVRGNHDPDWMARARSAVRTLAASGLRFTSYDVSLMGVEEPDHPSRWGALFAGCRAEGLIVRMGDTISKRPGRDKGRCSVWRGVRREDPTSPTQLGLFDEQVA